MDGYTQISIAQIESMLRKREIALPEFQRSFDWEPQDVVSLLTTVFRDWPSGSLLLLEAGDVFKKLEVRPVEGAPAIDEDKAGLKYLILDGQQRITSLYRAITNSDPDHVYYVDMGRLAGRKTFDDDYVKVLSRAKYPDAQGAANNGWASTDVLYSESKFDRWLELVAPSKADKMSDVFDRLLSPIRLYSLPANTLKADIELRSLVRIFTRLNREGLPLETFDLMVALMVPGGFKLREEAEVVQNLCGGIINGLEGRALESFAVGMNVSKIVTLNERERQRRAGETVTVDGVREDDVVDLVDRDPVTFKNGWQPAADEFVNALTFVRDNCGVSHRSVLPPHALLQVLALSLDPSESRPNWESDLIKWTWTAWITGEYVAGTNTAVLTGAKDLHAWAVDPSQTPSVMGVLRSNPEDMRVRLEGSVRGNKQLQTGVMAMLIADGAKDWLVEEPGGEPLRLSDHTGRIEFHHIFPNQYLLDRGKSNDMVMNFTPLTARTNKRLGKQAPSQVCEMTDFAVAALKGHCVDRRHYQADHEQLSEFIEDRTRRLLALIATNTGVSEIAVS